MLVSKLARLALASWLAFLVNLNLWQLASTDKDVSIVAGTVIATFDFSI